MLEYLDQFNVCYLQVTLYFEFIFRRPCNEILKINLTMISIVRKY